MRFIQRLMLTGLAILSVTSAALIYECGPAAALMRRAPTSSFGPGGPGVGKFLEVQGIAIDQSTGDVFVLDRNPETERGFIYKFNSSGEPQEFTALKTDMFELSPYIGFPGDNEIAVDSSSGPAKGDIYFAGESYIEVYGSDGVILGTLQKYSCGVTVDATGSVYTDEGKNIYKFTPTAKLVTEADFNSSFLAGVERGCNIATDSGGDVYVAESPVTKFPASKFTDPSAEGVPVDPNGRTLAADPLTNEIYIDETNGVSAYDSSGKITERFAGALEPGAISGSYGIAVYAPTVSTSDVYVASGVSGQVEIFGPGVIVPDVTTGLVSAVQAGAATIEGTVNPDNTTLTSCRFEYGMSTAYGSVAECASIPPPGENPVAVSAKLTGLLPGTLYHYRLISSNSNGTTQGVDQTLRGPAIVGGLAASNVSQFSATLTGTIDPGPIPASYHFVYGTSTAYGSVAPIPDVYAPLGYAEDNVSQVIDGLKAGTTYHYALVAADVAATVTGPDETFTTPSVPAPAASTGAATEVTRSSAVLSGTVDPMGWDTTYRFEYGTSTAYGASWPTVDIDMGALTGNQSVLIALQNLQPLTTYHYRLVATNPGGTTYGADQTFTTGGYPVSIIEVAPIGSPIGIPPAKTTKPKHKSKSKAKTHKRKKSGKKPKRKK